MSASATDRDKAQAASSSPVNWADAATYLVASLPIIAVAIAAVILIFA